MSERVTTEIPPSVSRDAVLAPLIERDILRPVLDINGCHFCASPRRRPRRSYACCAACLELGPKHKFALYQFEPVAFSDDDEPLEGIMRGLKGLGRLDASWLRLRRLLIAAPLSAYLEANAEHLRLESESVVTTAIPSTGGVILQALTEARRAGWYVPRLVETAERAAGIRSQRQVNSRELRMQLRANAWKIDRTAIEGRAVVVLDDVYTTGASMHSFARALKDAGAKRVCGVALVRHIGGTVYQEQLVARRSRVERLVWSQAVRRVGRWGSA